jgi:hypothetical protein
MGVERRRRPAHGARSRSRSPPAAGFIAGSHEVVDFLRVSSRAFLFTAAAVPGGGRRRARRAADHPLPRRAAAVRPPARERRVPAPGTRRARVRGARRRVGHRHPDHPGRGG